MCLFRFSFPLMMTDTTDLIEFRARRLHTRVFNPARKRIEREHLKNTSKNARNMRDAYEKMSEGVVLLLMENL
jgi:hypothetical protein